MKKVSLLIVAIMTIAVLTGCSGVSRKEFQSFQATQQAMNEKLLEALNTPTPTPFQPAAPTATPAAPTVPAAPTPVTAVPPTAIKPTPTLINFGDYEAWTVPNEKNTIVDGTYVINDNQIAMIWWKVTVNGNRLRNPNPECPDYAGAILYPGEYQLHSPGRIRVWDIPTGYTAENIVQWWKPYVQNEAGNCPYSWTEFREK